MLCRLVRWLPALILVACGPSPSLPDGSPGCGTGAGRLEVGSGGARLRALPTEGAELQIVQGSQGGIHVVVGVWVQNIDLEMRLHYHLEEVDSGAPVGDETNLDLRASLFSAAGSRYQRHPDLIVLNNEAAPVEDFRGRTVALVAEAVSVDGSHACDRRVVTLTAPPAEP